MQPVKRNNHKFSFTTVCVCVCAAAFICDWNRVYLHSLRIFSVLVMFDPDQGLRREGLLMHHLFKVCLNTDYCATPGRLTVAVVMAATGCPSEDQHKIQRDENSKYAQRRVTCGSV